MRFIENGPSIPDELLQARDEGRVVFFCGAGVSQARAGLADFSGLAESVIAELGVTADHDACKVLRLSREIEDETDVTGLISADRVFSLLERDFTLIDIQAEVAKSLKPAVTVDRSAHEILLRLSRTPDERTQLVTTNFDRLFESDEARLQLHQPPRLPNLARHDVLDGIVYLHGRVDKEYTAADGNGFVLSSADFGHAYLSEGWATEFFREIVRRYVVVFVGYSADDPPINYLLEGLRRSSERLNRIYAFQSEESAELIARWEHRRVTAIPYAPADRHGALWNTLEQWAIRADDPDAWQRSVLERAMNGPQQLLPHERGQIAHIVSSYQGARAFAEAKPPAEWLCVLDASCRCQSPTKSTRTGSENQQSESDSLYGLDSDVVPERSGVDLNAAGERVPTGVWDAFALNQQDLRNLSPHHVPAVREQLSSTIPRLPNRLAWLAKWIGDVVKQPAAIWWAACHNSLHPSFRRSIEWGLARNRAQLSGVLRNAWEYILDAWNTSSAASDREWHRLRREYDQDGWSHAGVRRFLGLATPRLTIGPGAMSRPFLNSVDDDCRISDLVQIKVEYEVPSSLIDIPDEWLRHVVSGLRTSLEASLRLCEEVDDPHRQLISPIEEDGNPHISDYQRTRGLSGLVITFASLFDRLVQFDAQCARAELAAWPTDEEIAFARLRLWASGKRQMATSHAFAKVVLGLSDNVFWGGAHQRDLLLVLARRWSELSDRDQSRVEARLLRGPVRWEDESDASYKSRGARAVMDRLQWLRSKGATFSIDVDDEIAARRSDAPHWRPEFADRAADSRESRSGSVRTDTACGMLLREPICSVLEKAREVAERPGEDFLVERDPFTGLVSERPKRAYLALASAAKRGECPKWAWEAFLHSSGRRGDPSGFSAVIAARLRQLSDAQLLQILYAATHWLREIGGRLSEQHSDSFNCTVQRFIDVLRDNPEVSSSICTESDRVEDRLNEATGSPVGHIVWALYDGVRVAADQAKAIDRCLEKMGQCLTLPGNSRRYAIALASRKLDWFYRIDREWTERYLLSILDAEYEGECESLWAGFLFDARISSPELYLRIRDRLLSIVTSGIDPRGCHAQALAHLVLSGWITPVPDENCTCVADTEFRHVLLQGGDEFRSHVLWQMDGALQSNEAAEREIWRSKLPEFFTNVWPRQKSVKTSKTSIRICEFLSSDVDRFASLIDVVLPLLTTIEDGAAIDIQFRCELDDLIRAHAKSVLRLLHVILSNDPRSWPYGIGEKLAMIAAEDETLTSDPRLLDLRRRWNAR